MALSEDGRTHQLRVHCAHQLGLNNPIKGDRLYGTACDRLYLHAEMLSFRHPADGREMNFTAKAPFQRCVGNYPTRFFP